MAKLHFTDIVAMAKSGWTPDAVNSMLDKFEAINAKDENDESDSEGKDETDSANENDATTSNEGQDDSDSTESDEKDKRIADLEKQVEELQKQNSHRNNGTDEQKSLDDMVDDIFKEFYD